MASKDYAIVNCHHVVDCVNQERSTFKWDGLDDPSMVVKRIELRADALGADDRLVRPKFVPGKAFYRADFRNTLLAQRFTGLGFSREVFGDFDVYEQANKIVSTHRLGATMIDAGVFRARTLLSTAIELGFAPANGCGQAGRPS